jgi:hypothetical protein
VGGAAFWASSGLEQRVDPAAEENPKTPSSAAQGREDGADDHRARGDPTSQSPKASELKTIPSPRREALGRRVGGLRGNLQRRTSERTPAAMGLS